MKITKILILTLMFIALAVFVIKMVGGDGWLLIAGYWLVLTIKNFFDWRNTNKKQ